MSAPIFFIHPPKSGGSTVVSFFELNLGKSGFVQFEWDRPGWENCRSRLLQTGAGGGHLPYGIHRDLKIALRYCAILRDPLARQISHYRYALNGKNGAVELGASVSSLEALVRRGNLTLDEWVGESMNGGNNLYVQMLSGRPIVDQQSLELARIHLRRHITTFGFCENISEFLLRLCGTTGLRLPFYFETNKTCGTAEQKLHLSETAKQDFIEQNSLDYQLFHEAKEDVDRYAKDTGSIFTKALELVQTIQAEINRLDNPYLYNTILTGFDDAFLAKVCALIRQYDLEPLRAYLQFAHEHRPVMADFYEGHVDTVQNGAVSGWAVNLSQPEASVPLEVRAGARVVACGWSGESRPDVARAGFPSAQVGFSIPLPADLTDTFQVAIAGSPESLSNAGPWRQGWHCA
ncbi:sulfotransferase family 2 domain-containing protein [Paraburkholderia sp. BCC1886]|uniref:sulfotransferase family 2 domain-containing protein n=1 Tax=Paraburkholderia sp. BCC1886 TaxID=2562670 RepID=UPI001182F21A|nr:sulfotransferase family 2 domain-containing protein [Paraburkholderia sp. BCC1886]